MSARLVSAGLVSRLVPARLLVVLLGVLAALAVAGPAQAHVGGAVAGSDFDARVLAVRPALPGVSVRVLNFGDDLEVVNSTRTEIEVPGYNDEPYLRIGPDGVWRNERSPATYINLDRYARTPLPAEADPKAAPAWVRVSTRPEYVWHDHRTHWMTPNLLPPMVAADPAHPHTVARWTIPMSYDGAPVSVVGELTWSPPPPGWAVWPAYVLLFLAAVAAGALARTPKPLAGLLALAAAAALWHALATPEPPVTEGSQAGAIVSALLPALLALLAAVVGLRAALRGRGSMTGLMAVVLGWLALVLGLPDVDVLWSAHVLSGGPQVVGRAAVAILIAAGAGCVVGGAFAARRFREAHAAVPPSAVPPSAVPS